MVRFTIAQKNRVVGMLQTGMSSRAVATAFDSCHSTILRLWTLFQQTGRCSPSILLAGRAQLVNMLITLEPHGIFGSNFVY